MDEPVGDGVLKRPVVDVVLGAVVAVVGYATAHSALMANYRVAPGIEDLFATCTGRLGWMPDLAVVQALPQWTAFLERKIRFFPCDAISGFRLFEIGTSWEVQRYFHVALYEWFRLVGRSIEGFITFQSLSYAATCVIAYLIFRLGMGRVVALVCAAAMVWSPSHLAMAGLPVEYAKAPWVLAAVWLCGVIVLRGAAHRPLAWPAAALGLVTGVGIGFKPDLIAVVPLAVLTPALFAGGRRRQSLTAALLVATGVAVGGGSMLYRSFLGPNGSAFPIQVIGGQDWQTESLHATNSFYDYGVTWDDTYVDEMINSYGRRVLGITARLRFFTREMQRVANHALVDLWTTFPGDLVLRVIAAVFRVLWLNGLSPLVALAGLFVVLCRDRRQGWFVLFATVYLGASVSLVFQRRHIFHLEFVPWWLAGVVAQAVLLAAAPLREAICERDWSGVWGARDRLVKPASGAALSLALVGAGTWGLLTAARQVQQARMIRLVDHYVQMPREPHRVTSTGAAAGNVSLRIDALTAADNAYLIVAFQCRERGVIRVASKYAPPIADWSNWNRDFSVICVDAGQESTMMVPVYQPGAAYRFDRLVMSEVDAASIVSVSTMRTDPSVTLWPDLLLPADWRARRWFETMKVPLAMPL
jgi:hypothetical protein